MNDLLIAQHNQAALKIIAERLYREAKTHVNSSEWDKSIQLFSDSAKLFEIIGENEWASRIFGRIAWSYIPAQNYLQVDEHLEYAAKLDLLQGAGNYLGASYHCLRRGDIDSARKYFRTFMSRAKGFIGTEEDILSVRSEHMNYKDWFILYNKVAVEFYSKLIAQEQALGWQQWAMSDVARRYATLAEIDHLRGDSKTLQFNADKWYLAASSAYMDAELPSHSAFFKAKYYLALISKSRDYKQITEYLSNAILELDKVGEKMDQEADIADILKYVAMVFKDIVDIREKLFQDGSPSENSITAGIKTAKEHLAAASLLIKSYSQVEEASTPLIKMIGALSEILDFYNVGEKADWEERTASALVLVNEANANISNLDFIGFRRVVELEIVTLEVLVRDLSIRSKENKVPPLNLLSNMLSKLRSLKQK